MTGVQVLRASALMDGLSGELRADPEVIVKGQHIVDVRQSSRASRSGVRMFDLPGATIMPGLIDCHVHLSGLHVGGELDACASSAARVALDTAAVLGGMERLLRGGVTTVRDCGYPHHGLLGIREGQALGLVRGPRLILSGRAIRTTAGHGAGISVRADGADAIRRAARKEIGAGVDWLKLMVTGGTASPHERAEDLQMTLEEATAAVTEAHARGRKVAAHCSNRVGAHLALDAGVDSIEHGIDLDDAAIGRMVEQGTWLSAGLRCTRVEAESSAEAQIPEYVRRKASELVALQAESFQRALARGVGIVASTDAGPSYFPVGAKSLVDELTAMHELGMARTTILSAATGRAAQLLGLRDVGVVRRGAKADIMVVRGDPTSSLEELRRVELVMVDGRIVVEPEACS